MVAKICQNIFIKAQFESPKYLHQNTFEPLKYLQPTYIYLNIMTNLPYYNDPSNTW
jgi:hypothetical protein